MIGIQHMLTRRRLIPLARTILSSALLGACVAAPDDVARLSAESPLDRDSSHGLVAARVSLDSPELTRGPNDFSITLRAAQSPALPELTSVVASMAAHGHRASAASILRDGETFHAVDLDLFMSGRWQIALGVELEGSSDHVEFALDVP